MSRSNRRGAPLSLQEIADLVGGRAEGPDMEGIVGVSALADAEPDEMGFLSSKRYLDHADESTAKAFLVSEELASAWPSEAPRVVVENAHRALRLLLDHFHPVSPRTAKRHPTAVIHPSAVLGQDVAVGPYAVIGADTSIGDRVSVGAHAVLGAGVRVGDDTVIFPHVVLYDRTVLGKRVIVHAGARLGVDGYGYVLEDGRHHKVPQVGTCEIGDDVEIGANTCIDRGSIGRTVIGTGTKLDNLVHVAHNVHVGEHCLLVAQVGIAGSTEIGRGVMFGGQSGATGHVRIGDGAAVGAQAGVMRCVDPGETVMGFPARPRSQFLRAHGGLFRLDSLMKTVRDLAGRVARLEGRGEAAGD